MPSILPGLAERIMTKGIITATSDASLFDAARIMEEKGIGSLVIVDKGEIVGIITESDFVKATSEVRDPKKVRVSELMSKPVITCNPDTPIVKVLTLMKTKRVRHIPVIKEGKLLGMISDRDISRSKLTDLALFFHSMLFGYYKAISDVLKTGCTVLAPYVADSILKIYERSGIELVRGETLDGIITNFTSSLIEVGLAEEVSLVEEEKDKFAFEVRNCIFTDPTHALLAPKEVICPFSLLAASVLRKATQRQVVVGFSEFVPKGTRTYIKLT